MTDREKDTSGRDQAGDEDGREPVGAVGTEAEEAGPEEDVSAEVEELRAELDSLNDRHLRLAAEFDNYRKRNERDRQTWAARLQADLVGSMVEVLDDLERVTDTGEQATADTVLEGVELVQKKFRTVLENAGLEPLDAEGEAFDPETMEALMTVPTADESLDDHVADVFQKGYRFRDTLLRPARVRVHKYDPSTAESE